MMTGHAPFLGPARLVPVPTRAKPVYPKWAPMQGRTNGPKMGQAAGIAALAAVPLLLGAAIGAGTAWVGFSTGAREKGFLSVLGYLIGSVGALGALGGVLGTILTVAGVGILSAAEERAERSSEEFFRRTPSAPAPTTPSLPEFSTEPPSFPFTSPEEIRQE